MLINSAPRSFEYNKTQQLNYTPNSRVKNNQKTQSQQVHFAGGFDDVAGMKDIKETLLEKFVSPLRKVLNPSLVKTSNRVKPANGLLLYGPPGTGKSFLAKKVAEEVGLPVVEVLPEDRTGMAMGEAEEKLAAKFDEAESLKPCVMIFDEFDSVVPRIQAGSHDDRPVYTERRAQILTRLEKAQKNGITVIGTTNKKPHELDPASMRSGRMDVKIEVPNPDREARKALFQTYIQKSKVAGAEFPITYSQLDQLAKDTVGLSAAAIVDICESATSKAEYRDKNVNFSFLSAALEEKLKEEANTNSRVMESPSSSESNLQSIEAVIVNAVRSGNAPDSFTLSVNGQDLSPWFIAIASRNTNLVTFLLQNGIHPDQRLNEIGSTALMLAAHTSDNDTVQALLEGGADLDATDNDGDTVRQYALAGQNMQLLAFLQARDSQFQDSDSDSESTSSSGSDNPVRKLAEIFLKHFL